MRAYLAEFLGGPDSGFGQRPYGRRCDACPPRTFALQSGSGALLNDDGGAIPATALVAGTWTTVVTLAAFAARAGDRILAWANPVIDGDDGTTSVAARIRFNGIDSVPNSSGEGVPTDGDTAMPVVVARYEVPATGNIVVDLQVRCVGAAGQLGASGQLMYAHYRSPPI